MVIVLAALTLLPNTGLGAPFPDSKVAVEPHQAFTKDVITKRQECFIDYQLQTTAAIQSVDDFYQHEAQREGEAVFDDSENKFVDYRTITFLKPRFMFIALNRKDESTTVKVSFKPKVNCG